MSAPMPFPEPSSDSPYGTAPPPQPQVPFASWGSRVGAHLLDALFLLLLVGAPLGVMYAVLLSTIDDDDAGSFFVLGWYAGLLLFYVLYYPLTMRRGAHNGQTWGKQIVGIRVVKDSGERITGGAAFVREGLVKGFLMNLCSIVAILDFLAPLWDNRNQAWHDKLVSTVVVKA
ncbi:RDD family protein [Solirubrobacter taibaiensis]|nr:RDD family protein [Solirubrobacter taibaiensis]